MNEVSKYLEPFASLQKGYTAGAIGHINENQNQNGYPTTGPAFERCPPTPIDEEQLKPVVEMLMLEIYLTFCIETQCLHLHDAISRNVLQDTTTHPEEITVLELKHCHC